MQPTLTLCGKGFFLFLWCPPQVALPLCKLSVGASFSGVPRKVPLSSATYLNSLWEGFFPLSGVPRKVLPLTLSSEAYPNSLWEGFFPLSGVPRKMLPLPLSSATCPNSLWEGFFSSFSVSPARRYPYPSQAQSALPLSSATYLNSLWEGFFSSFSDVPRRVALPSQTQPALTLSSATYPNSLWEGFFPLSLVSPAGLPYPLK